MDSRGDKDKSKGFSFPPGAPPMPDRRLNPYAILCGAPVWGDDGSSDDDGRDRDVCHQESGDVADGGGGGGGRGGDRDRPTAAEIRAALEKTTTYSSPSSEGKQAGGMGCGGGGGYYSGSDDEGRKPKSANIAREGLVRKVSSIGRMNVMLMWPDLTSGSGSRAVGCCATNKTVLKEELINEIIVSERLGELTKTILMNIMDGCEEVNDILVRLLVFYKGDSTVAGYRQIEGAAEDWRFLIPWQQEKIKKAVADANLADAGLALDEETIKKVWNEIPSEIRGFYVSKWDQQEREDSSPSALRK